MAMIHTKSSEMLKWQFVVLSAKHSKMLRFCYYTVKLEDVWNKSSQKQSNKKTSSFQRCGATNGWESDTVPESFLSSVALMIAALKAQQPYEMEKKIEKYGTLESSALLYFSKVSSSSACLMEARWNTTSSGFATKVVHGWAGWRLKKKLPLAIITWFHQLAQSGLILVYLISRPHFHLSLKLSSSFCRAAIAHCSSSSWFQFISSLNLRCAVIRLQLLKFNRKAKRNNDFAHTAFFFGLLMPESEVGIAARAPVLLVLVKMKNA